MKLDSPNSYHHHIASPWSNTDALIDSILWCQSWHSGQVLLFYLLCPSNPLSTK
uniref:Uncharacterized protein n=1 Tax=Siphoviridae sp. ctgN495 TaxID=2825608 RepID=A0A8S5UCL4_9CAUD|nr:MAG TPA: hypothetical protein [Siphoviridae sp. ctgN495]